MSVIGRLLGRGRQSSRSVAGAVSSDADSLLVEPMRRQHLDQVMSIEFTAYPKPWSRAVFEDELAMQSRGSRHYVVALLGGRVVGYGGMIYMDDAAHITNVAVDSALRRRGVATEIMLDLSWEARRVGMASLTLEVRESNVSAQSLYRRFGFAPVGVRSKYYENRDDAIVMWCTDIQGDDFLARLRTIERERGEQS